MTRTTIVTAALLIVASVTVLSAGEIPADHYGKVLFQDDFSAAELSKTWRLYSSEARIEDGKLHCIMKPGHNAVQNVNVEPGPDFEVSVRFKPVDKNIGLQIAFNDRSYKDSHAGHICRVALTPKGVKFQDGKFGVFSNKVYAQKEKDGSLNDESKAVIAAHQKFVDFPITGADWSTAVVRIKGDTMELVIDGKDVGSYQSEGIAHATKSNIAFVVGKDEMYLDDVVIKAP
ncbi:MAG: hypothetical protein GC162_15010 [Planctomycetes bacterium]|nr:hypothetical protein [Planctomycetota bacterium]